MERMRAQAEHLGVRMVGDVVTSVDLSRRPFVVALDGGETWTADMLVIATGASARGWAANETKLRGHGVSACATCDGFSSRQGSGRGGRRQQRVEEAMFLTNFAKRVHWCTAADGLRADRTNQRRCSRTKVELHWNKAVADVLATHDGMGVRGIALLDTKTGDASELPHRRAVRGDRTRPRDVAVPRPAGHGRGRLYPRDARPTATSVPGVFAAGDVTDRCTGRRSRPWGG
jgi:thioredoxin reductase (NADPH)